MENNEKNGKNVYERNAMQNMDEKEDMTLSNSSSSESEDYTAYYKNLSKPRKKMVKFDPSTKSRKRLHDKKLAKKILFPKELVRKNEKKHSRQKSKNPEMQANKKRRTQFCQA